MLKDGRWINAPRDTVFSEVIDPTFKVGDFVRILYKESLDIGRVGVVIVVGDRMSVLQCAEGVWKTRIENNIGHLVVANEFLEPGVECRNFAGQRYFDFCPEDRL